MSLLPRLLLASQLSRRALQAQLQACLGCEGAALCESIREGPLPASGTVKPFTTSSPCLKNNKHSARPASVPTTTSSAKPHINSAKANDAAPPGSLAGGQKKVVGTAGTATTAAAAPKGEAPKADLASVNTPVHDTGAAEAAPTFGAKGSPTTAGVNSPGVSGGGLPGGKGLSAIPPAGGGGSAGTLLLLLATLGAGGGAYYYWDDVKGYLPEWVDGKRDTGSGQKEGVKESKSVIEDVKKRVERAVEVGKKESLPEESGASESVDVRGKNGETGSSGDEASSAQGRVDSVLVAEDSRSDDSTTAPSRDVEKSGEAIGWSKQSNLVGETATPSEAVSSTNPESDLEAALSSVSESLPEAAPDATASAETPAQKSPAEKIAEPPQESIQALLDGSDTSASEEGSGEEDGELSKGGADVSTGPSEGAAGASEHEGIQELTKVLQEAVKKEGGEEETEASKKAKEHVHNLERAFEEVEKRTSSESEELAPESLVLQNIRQTHARAEKAKLDAEKARQEAIAQREREEEEDDSGPFQRPSYEEAVVSKEGGFDELAVGVAGLAAEAERLKREHFEYLGGKGTAALGALIAEAVKEAVRSQAETDSEEFRRKIEELHEEHRAELADARAEALRHAQIVHKLERDLSRQKAAYRNALREQLRRGEEKRYAELQANLRRAEALVEEARTTAAAKAALTVAEERKERAGQMDDLRLKINALQDAFSSRSREAEKSHTAHKLAMGAFALEDALDRGKPLQEEVRLLAAAVDEKDPLVMAALSSLPPNVAHQGAPTRAQLQEQFESLRGRAKQLVLLPPGGGGMLAHALAWAASTLKVKEPAPQNGSHSDTATSDTALARAEALLAQNKLEEAAYVLAKGFEGTGAEGLVRKWAEDARSRAVAEQALAVIQAQATSLAASLS